MPDGPNPTNQQQPPDLLALLKRFMNSTQKRPSQDSQASVFKTLGFIMLLVVVMYTLAGFYKVSFAELAVVQRFGRVQSVVQPGLHWLPLFIEKKTLVNVQQIRNFQYRSNMLTTDENIVSAAVAVQYRISDPRKFLFHVVNPVKTIQQATSSALRQIVGQMTLDSVLTTGRSSLSLRVAATLNNILKIYDMGIEVRDVTLQATKPPEAVTAAFDDVVKAREDRQRFVNQANAYSKKIMFNAQGEVARITQEALAYEQQVVLQAKGTTVRYLALLKPFQVAPKVTRDRLYLDMMTHVLSKSSNIVVDAGKGSGNLTLLPLNKWLERSSRSSGQSNHLAMSDSSSPADSSQSNASGSAADRPSYTQGAQ